MGEIGLERRKASHASPNQITTGMFFLGSDSEQKPSRGYSQFAARAIAGQKRPLQDASKLQRAASTKTAIEMHFLMST